MTTQTPPAGPKARPMTALLSTGRFHEAFRPHNEFTGKTTLSEGLATTAPPKGMPKFHLQDGILRMGYYRDGSRYIVEQQGESVVRVELKNWHSKGNAGQRTALSSDEKAKFVAEVMSLKDGDAELSAHVEKHQKVFGPNGSG